jgi:hypothetical protein
MSPLSQRREEIKAEVILSATSTKDDGEPAWAKEEGDKKPRGKHIEVLPNVDKPNVVEPKDIKRVFPKSINDFHTLRDPPAYMLVITFEGVLASLQR